MDTTKVEPYAAVIIKLLREVVSTDDQKEWKLLLAHNYAIQEYFNRMGLELFISTDDGYAYLQQPTLDEENIRLPRLTRRVPLSIGQTLLLVLLRERLDEFLNQPQDSSELILTDEDIYHMMEPFMPDRRDSRKLYKQITSIISQIIDMGFLKPLSAERKNHYIVQRIIKSKVNSELIAKLKQRITEHYQNDGEA